MFTVERTPFFERLTLDDQVNTSISVNILIKNDYEYVDDIRKFHDCFELKSEFYSKAMTTIHILHFLEFLSDSDYDELRSIVDDVYTTHN